MFAIDFFDSADPVFDFLQKQRSRLFMRPYAGYFLFLFGSADEEVATWFARNITSLDSLTGSSLAGLVFAERVRVRAQRTVMEAPRGSHLSHFPSPNASGIVEADRIRIVPYTQPPYDSRERSNREFEVHRLVARDHTEIRYAEQEITAVTYGSDALAKLFGVLEDLPCIVLLDAIPTGTIEIIELRAFEPSEVINLLRRLVAEFTARERFKPFFDLMIALHETSNAIDANATLRSELLSQLADVQSLQSSEVWELNASQAFIQGDYKRVRKILWEDSHLAQHSRTPILRKLKDCKFARHSDGSLPSNMRHEFLALLPNRERDLERLEELREIRRVEVTTRVEACDVCRSELQFKQQQLEERVTEVEVPSLQAVFRQISSHSRIKAESRSVGGAVFEWVRGFLKPDILFKLAEHLTRH